MTSKLTTGETMENLDPPTAPDLLYNPTYGVVLEEIALAAIDNALDAAACDKLSPCDIGSADQSVNNANIDLSSVIIINNPNPDYAEVHYTVPTVRGNAPYEEMRRVVEIHDTEHNVRAPVPVPLHVNMSHPGQVTQRECEIQCMKMLLVIAILAWTALAITVLFTFFMSNAQRQNVRNLTSEDLGTERSLIAINKREAKALTIHQVNAEPPHPDIWLEDNLWYRHQRMKVKQVSNESCYVCAVIPHAVDDNHQRLVAVEVPRNVTECLLHLLTCDIRDEIQPTHVTLIRKGMPHLPIPPGKEMEAIIDPSNEERVILTKRTSKGAQRAKISVSTFLERTGQQFTLERDEQGKLFLGRDATLGRIINFITLKGEFMLENVWVPVERSCEAVLINGTTESVINRTLDQCLKLWQTVVRKLTWLDNMQAIRIRSLTRSSLCFLGNGTVPLGVNDQCNETRYEPSLQRGTATIMDTWWVCGQNAYARLLPDWGGSCTLSTLHQPTLIVPLSTVKDLQLVTKHPLVKRPTLRAKREAAYWPKNLDIPVEQRLFSKAQIVFGSIALPYIPNPQAMANALWIERTRWEMMTLINSTSEGLNAISLELRALRLISLQNRYVIDYLTAKSGGACAIIGSSCCTFVPDLSLANSSLVHAIGKLHELSQNMTEESGIDPTVDNWLGSLFSWMPSWLASLLKAFLPSLVAIVLIGLLICCCIGLCKKLSTKLIAGIFLMHNPVMTSPLNSETIAVPLIPL